MKRTMFHFEYEGKKVLGFDTGLNVRAFAQSKAGVLVTESGYFVTKEGAIEVWNPEGVIELDNRMVIWGPDFEGVLLDELTQAHADKDEALNAVRCWLQASSVLLKKNICQNPSPHRAVIAKNKTVFFLPPKLAQKVFNDESEILFTAALRPLYTNLKTSDVFVFYAGTLLYHIFSGEAAFQTSSFEDAVSDIQAGNFLPLNFAAPGLDEKTIELIHKTIAPKDIRIGLQDIIDLLGAETSKKYGDFFIPISDEEKESLSLRRGQFQKRSQEKVKTKRFFHKNKKALIGIGIGIAVALLITWDTVTKIRERPTTEGLSPYEVAEQYYASFGTLNNDFMETAVVNNAGKDDIQMVQNLFIISKVRQAYEMMSPVTPAQEWIDAESPQNESMVFGVSNLNLAQITQSENEALFKADYILWMPKSFISDNEQDPISDSENPRNNDPPVSVKYSSEIHFIKKKNAWYISEIIKHQN